MTTSLHLKKCFSDELFITFATAVDIKVLSPTLDLPNNASFFLRTKDICIRKQPRYSGPLVAEWTNYQVKELLGIFLQGRARRGTTSGNRNGWPRRTSGDARGTLMSRPVAIRRHEAFNDVDGHWEDYCRIFLR